MMKGSFLTGMMTGGIIGAAAIVTAIIANPSLQGDAPKKWIRRGRKMMRHYM
jgi:gas vesicle protein